MSGMNSTASMTSAERVFDVIVESIVPMPAMPTVPTVPFAKRTGTDIPTSYAYLTKNLDGFQSSGNVTWDATEKAAKFDGGTLTLNNFDAFANVDHDSAFAICFDFKKTSSNPTYGFVFQLDNGVGVNENRFGFNAGGSDDHRGLTYATINNSHNVYWSQDFGDSSKAFISQNNGSWGTSWKPENDTWYNVALFMAGGELQYYLNGNWIGTFNAPSEGSLTNAQIMDNMKNLTTLFVGKSSNSGDGTFRGYVKNLQFFSYAQNNAPSALKTALDAYEAKMEDGKVYKNLSNAYAKYQQAAARYDAYIYGDLDLTAQTNGTTNSDLLNGASQELALATGAMLALQLITAYLVMIQTTERMLRLVIICFICRPEFRRILHIAGHIMNMVPLNPMIHLLKRNYITPKQRCCMLIQTVSLQYL